MTQSEENKKWEPWEPILLALLLQCPQNPLLRHMGNGWATWRDASQDKVCALMKSIIVMQTIVR
ncbi:hypothetical protein TYRP_021590 [Tyrophagus putrescentiae]|nr:hypothetical protein TYRP_021590 [Tyrophagus putrescentiae]